MRRQATTVTLPGWDRLRHGGLLLDSARLTTLAQWVPAVLDEYSETQLRQRANAILDGSGETSPFVAFVLERVCGLDASAGAWSRGNNVPATARRRAITGESVKPNHLWEGPCGAALPVFLDGGKRLGIGKSRRVVSQALGWLRMGNDHLALVTNGRQWRLLFAGLDYDAWCEWDLDLWFEEGRLSPQVAALRTLLRAKLWTPEADDAAPPLLQAIRDTRKGQAELSEVLGERVREAVEILIQGHGDALRALIDASAADTAEYHAYLADSAGVSLDAVPPGNDEARAASTPEDIYRAACRVAMRLVVILFAESRDLLPRDNTLYHESYGLNGLLERLERDAAQGRALGESFSAWPRVLALFRLVREGSHHPDLPVMAYGGELFSAGAAAGDGAADGMSQALAVLEYACFAGDVLPDRDVHRMLKLLTRTTVRIRQGRASTSAVVPVDFSDLSSEYIGILYEGLLDYELKTAPYDDPVIFLAVGDQPALPLSRLEAMDNRALKALFSGLKNRSKPADEAAEEDGLDESPKADGGFGAGDEQSADDTPARGVMDAEAGDPYGPDERQRNRIRAESWARRAAQVLRLVKKPRGRNTPERQLAFEQLLGAKAGQLVRRVVLPGEWYLVRWGGTRKGSGSFYTRPGLAIPTVQRTLRPLVYDPPPGTGGAPNVDAPPATWTPKPPEQILGLAICDPACGSGTFPLAALRFLTDALYASLQHHGRIERDGERALVRLLGIRDSDSRTNAGEPLLGEELIPCRPDDDSFEPRLKALLRRHVVERCIYAVDLDPLAVELCRLSLWIETMDRTLPFGFLDHKIKCGNSLIGAWFDQFQHYPVMAWKNREGGDKNHSNGVHFAKNARAKAIKAFVKDKLTPDLRLFLNGRDLFQDNLLEQATTAHNEALEVLAHMHELPVQDAIERARMYREDLQGSDAWRSLKGAMDLWCACWFWLPDEIDRAPLPSTFAEPSVETRAVAERIAAEMRFFHWELEFPDVYRQQGSGFDAILGNPPWETLQPNSKEYFSNIDPLYGSYGKQEALGTQTTLFDLEATEWNWLNYNERFANYSNWMKHAGNPFGDPLLGEKSQDRFAISRGLENSRLHDLWREARVRSLGYVDSAHPFIHRGKGKAYTYKLFLEQTHALCANGGRIGFIVPSGLYSDHGTRALRSLFLERCRWEWLFGIENREKVFPIDSRFKFNPVIVQKGGVTESIHTAFMRRKLEDWERAEDHVTSYSRAQVERFSPKSLAILEIQSARDLEILEKIYANGVLIGDDGTDGWGIRYSQGDFNMTSDSQLFPPRPQWEAKGYRPDEYSRWLLGDWRPIEELWERLGVDPSQPEPVEIELEDWLFDTSAGSKHRDLKARFVHGHLLKPGDLARTDWRVRCAQPPYDGLPVRRATVPAGVVLSREGDTWIREGEIQHVTLPFFEGRMIGQFDFCEKGWVSGKGRGAIWRAIPWEDKRIEPQYLMGVEHYEFTKLDLKLAIMDITSSTNTRTMIVSPVAGVPCGHSIGVLNCDSKYLSAICATLNSFAYDYTLRIRFSGLHTSWFVIEETPLPQPRIDAFIPISQLSASLGPTNTSFSRLILTDRIPMKVLTEHERLRISIILDVLIACAFGLELQELRHVLHQCDLPRAKIANAQLSSKGFWRVDKHKDPELRQSVLTLIAFHDLESKIRAADGEREQGLAAFLEQNHGEGWMLPETLCLADYGFGHDERAQHPRPVATCLGPRFYDWQLVQSAEECRRECHLHTRNLLGVQGYASLVVDLIERRSSDGDDSLDLLADGHTRSLLCEEGYIMALVNIRARGILHERAYWTMLDELQDSGDLDEGMYCRVLDSLRARSLIDEQEYRRRRRADAFAPNPVLLEEVAEPQASYRTTGQPQGKQTDLFE